MINEFDYPFLYPILLLILLVVLIFLKRFYYRKLRSSRSNKRFLKTFFRWYNSGEIEMEHDNSRKRKFMRISNWINLPTWIIIIIVVVKFIVYLVSVMPDAN